MKKTLLLLFILNSTINVNAQKYPTSQDSIKEVYNALFSKLQEGYLYKDTVNWHLIKSETEANLSKYFDFKESLNEIVPLFSKIGATHCAIVYEGEKYSISAQYAPDTFSEQWLKKYATNPKLEVKIIDGKYGYILMPAVSFIDTKPKNVNKISQLLYDQINALNSNNQIEGWIIDLRFNTGGHSWPMLLALYDFLGDNNISGTLNSDKKQTNMASLSKGDYLVDSKKLFRIKPKGKLLDNAKVAIITGAVILILLLSPLGAVLPPKI